MFSDFFQDGSRREWSRGEMASTLRFDSSSAACTHYNNNPITVTHLRTHDTPSVPQCTCLFAPYVHEGSQSSGGTSGQAVITRIFSSELVVGSEPAFILRVFPTSGQVTCQVTCYSYDAIDFHVTAVWLQRYSHDSRLTKQVNRAKVWTTLRG